MARRRFLLVGEGPSDLGRKLWLDASGVETELVGGAIREFVFRSLEQTYGIPREAVELESIPLKHIRKHSGGYAGKVRAAMVQADTEGFDALVFVMDRDRDAGRPRELEKGRDAARLKQVTIPTAIGCCIETVEAWLLADPSAVSEVLGINSSEIPPNPETLDGKEGSGQHPKDVMQRLQHAAPGESNWDEIYQEIAVKADLDRVARHCPRGFKPFLEELKCCAPLAGPG